MHKGSISQSEHMGRQLWPRKDTNTLLQCTMIRNSIKKKEERRSGIRSFKHSHQSCTHNRETSKHCYILAWQNIYIYTPKDKHTLCQLDKHDYHENILQLAKVLIQLTSQDTSIPDGRTMSNLHIANYRCTRCHKCFLVNNGPFVKNIHKGPMPRYLDKEKNIKRHEFVRQDINHCKSNLKELDDTQENKCQKTVKNLMLLHVTRTLLDQYPRKIILMQNKMLQQGSRRQVKQKENLEKL